MSQRKAIIFLLVSSAQNKGHFEHCQTKGDDADLPKRGLRLVSRRIFMLQSKVAEIDYRFLRYRNRRILLKQQALMCKDLKVLPKVDERYFEFADIDRHF